MLVGAAFLGVTIAFAKVSGIIKFYSTPSFAKNLNYVSKYEPKGDDGGVGATEEEIVDIAEGKIGKNGQRPTRRP